MISSLLPRARRAALLTASFASLSLACGGSPPPEPVTSIPVQPPPPPLVQASEPPPSAEHSAVTSSPPPASPGANGPRDARGMIGEAGALERSPHRATLLINSALVRTRPFANAIKKIITGVMSEWNEFMPETIVHPTRDIDWILVSGSLIAGTTHDNVFLAHYNLTEPRADAASAALLKALPSAKKFDVGVPGAKALFATVDGADRVYLRPKAGLFAIVPTSEGKHATELLRRVDEPRIVMSGELFRVSYSSGPMMRMFRSLPRTLRGMRMWAEPFETGIVLHAEADCRDPEAATEAIAQFDRFLARLYASPLVRVAFGGAIRKGRLWADGSTARARVELTADEIERLGAAACAMSHRNCAD